MAEFTKDIQTLTQQASAAPQLQTNTGSLATDVISAASFGLGLYRQNKAATALAGAKQQQADYQTKVSEGTLAFRNFKLSMSDQKIKGATYLRKEKSFLDDLGGGAQFKQEVIGGVNKLTGETTTTTMDAFDKAESRRQEDATELLNSATEGAIQSGLSTQGIEGMSQGEQAALARKGFIAKKEQEARAARLSNDIQSGSYEKMTAAKKTKTYLSNVMPVFSSEFSSRVNTNIEALGGFGSLKKDDLQEVITRERTTLDSKIKTHVETARAAGVELSLEQQNAFRQNAIAILNDFESLIGQEAVNKALAGVPDRLLSQNIVAGLTSGDASTRQAATIVALQMSGQTLSGVDIAENYKIIAGVIDGNKLDDDKATAKEEVDLATGAFKSPSNNDGSFTESAKGYNKDIAVNLFQGTPAQVKKAVESKGFDKLVTSVNDYQGKNFKLEDHKEMAALVYDVGARTISSAIAAAYNAPKTKMMGGMRGDRQAVNTDTSKNFSLDADTLELVPNEGFVWIGDEVKNYNNYIRKTIKSLEYLGGDVEGFKRDAASSLLSVK